MFRRRFAALTLAGCLLTNSGCFGLFEGCRVGQGPIGRWWNGPSYATAVAPAAVSMPTSVGYGMPGYGTADCPCATSGLYHPVGLSSGAHGIPNLPAGAIVGDAVPSGVPIQTIPSAPIMTTPGSAVPMTPQGPRITPVPAAPPTGVAPAGVVTPTPWHP